jgi:two-component system cell cycle sensor histidine kinase/response regulator CckA
MNDQQDGENTVEILIAEDSPTQAAQLGHHLTSWGYRVFTARNGREALAHTAKRKPSIIITDVVMPEMDGYTLCKNLKSQAALKDVPVILLTSLATPKDVLQGLECGADNFIRKPYDPRYLLSRVEHILANVELRQSEQAPSTGVHLQFGGKTYSIDAEKQQILDLLISTYEGAIQINQELSAKQLELARERDLLHTLMDNVPDFIYFKDIEGRYTRVNRAFEAALGAESASEILGKTDFHFFPEAFARASAEEERQILESGSPLVAKEELVQKPDGSQVWLSTTKMSIRDIVGSTTGTFGVSRDISQSKRDEAEIRKAKEVLEQRVRARTSELAEAYHRLEQELAEKERAQQLERETQARFQFLFEHNPLPMWVYDARTRRFLEANKTAIVHYGYSVEQFKRMQVDDILQSAETAEPDPREFKHRLRDGRIIDVHVTGHAIHWRGLPAMLEVAQDLTEQKRLQREFLQAQKMEAIGTLAAGVAHDFNNLLTIIIGYSSSIQERLESDDPAQEEIEEISRAGQRAATLTRQLLAFSRKQIFRPIVLNLNDTVAEMDRMLRRLIGEDIELITELDPSLAFVRADPGQLEQVIMNLAVNARDAMPGGGKLLIQTSNVKGTDAGDANSALPASYAQMSITDTGTGMDAATLARIFEPFFTTKEVGKGTGLGLSTVYGIVERSGGKVQVKSELGRGTTFQILLPNAVGEPAPAKTVRSRRASTANATVLVVEDEDALRSLECRLLERNGFTVLWARNGPEALHVCERYSGTIDLLVTDVVMPQMSGTELVEKLVEARPRLKVIFTSGYTDNPVVLQRVLAKEAEFLGKPFEPDLLLAKVEELLQAAKQGNAHGQPNQ